MATNEGKWDRIIRIVLGFALVHVSWSAWPAEANFLSMAGAVTFVSLVTGIIAFLTGMVGYCPLYQIFGVPTNKGLHA